MLLLLEKAKKNYICPLCHEKIKRGEYCTNVDGDEDGYSHAECISNSIMEFEENN